MSKTSIAILVVFGLVAIFQTATAVTDLTPKAGDLRVCVDQVRDERKDQSKEVEIRPVCVYMLDDLKGYFNNPVIPKAAVAMLPVPGVMRCLQKIIGSMGGSADKVFQFLHNGVCTDEDRDKFYSKDKKFNK